MDQTSWQYAEPVTSVEIDQTFRRLDDAEDAAFDEGLFLGLLAGAVAIVLVLDHFQVWAVFQ